MPHAGSVCYPLGFDVLVSFLNPGILVFPTTALSGSWKQPLPGFRAMYLRLFGFVQFQCGDQLTTDDSIQM